MIEEQEDLISQACRENMARLEGLDLPPPEKTRKQLLEAERIRIQARVLPRDPIIRQRLANRIRKLRGPITKAEAARRAKIRVNTWLDVERGGDCRISTIFRIAFGLRVPVETIFRNLDRA